MKQKGFTLVELMIVVTIIGVLAAIAVPQYSDYISRTKAMGTIVELESIKLLIVSCNADLGGFQECSVGKNSIPALNDIQKTKNLKKIDSITNGVISGESQATDSTGVNLDFVIKPVIDGAEVVHWITLGGICDVKRGLKSGQAGCG